MPPQLRKAANEPDSSGVVTFTWSGAGRDQADLTLKVPRNPQMNEAIQREKTLLTYLHHQLGQDPVYSQQFAHVYGSRPLGRSQALLLTAVPGKTLAAQLHWWNRAYYLNLSGRWLSDFHHRTITSWVVLDNQRLDWLITTYLDELWSEQHAVPALLPLPEQLEGVKKGVRHSLRPLLGQKIPLTVVHGAFQAHNIRVARGRVSGLDNWGNGRTEGLPWEDFWQFPLTLFQDTSGSIAESWNTLMAHRQTINDYWHVYRQREGLSALPGSPWNWLAWVCLVEAMKQLLPWQTNWEQYQYWLDMARCATNKLNLHE